MKKISLCFHYIKKVLPALVILLLLTDCSDLLLKPEKKPDHLLISQDDLSMFMSEEAELEVQLVDIRGNPITNIPGWIDTTYTASKNIIEVKNGKIIPTGSGETTLAVSIGDYSGEVSILVRPRLQMIQSTQSLDGSVPMVAGHDAAIRLFLSGNEQNIDRQSVTVELYENGSPVQTLTYSSENITLTKIKDNLSSLELFVPGSYIRPGLSVRVKMENGKSYPENPLPIEVKDLAEFHLRLIPIHVPAIGKTGDVNSQNVDEYMEALLDMFPISDYAVDIHSPVTVDANPNVDQGNFYSVALEHVRAVWLAEGKPDYYYYGVIPQDRGGIVGLGYIGEPQPNVYRQAVGWDYPGYKYRSATMAHELGHNMGRRHAPCGGVAGADFLYPYRNGSIGVFGYEVDERDLKHPLTYKDLMSYCEPAWISDYTYKAIMAFREKANSTANGSKQPSDVLLLWGRITNDKLILEPAFRIEAPVSMPAGAGPYTLSGYDKSGQQLFSLSFAGVRVSRDLNGTRHFAFTFPVERVNINALQTIRLSGRSLKVLQHADVPARLAQINKKALLNNVKASSVNTNTVSLEWKSSQYKMTLVKNARTGEVLGFTNRGISEIKTDAKKLKLYFSDGVHTTAAVVSVQ